ncbi:MULTISPECIES: zinc metalloprotease HtpX [Shouchella]|uniref:Protease HtpX homolog n=2 Tax=Shouchella TaxID=2893057 RepID=A0ABY7W1I4_9BACI|nr:MULTISPECIES: zinc metalloprotease HtpX [Shouchella]MED4129551.1 zinc metalloprotease HtpX [Shouchella miscanthi]WDF02813.1 zinc metalloprotease HtpX [Shouchella hunanensis]GAF22295.1 heat shock protein HtpX [Bacillus sp. JCM 19047]
MFYTQIARNKRNTVFLVCLFIVIVLGIGSAVTYVRAGDYISGAIFAGVIATVYTIFMITTSTNVVMRMNHAREITSSTDQAFLWHTVEGLSIAARIPMPRIYIIDDPSPNAFATGISPKSGAVAVTTGLMNRLNREEIEGVLAHEVAHIRNYDIRLSTIAVALVSAIAILSDIGMRFFIFSGGRNNNNKHPLIMIIALLLVLLAPIIAVVMQLAISRNREYLADASAVELTRNPEALATALERITDTHTPVEEASSSTASLYFADPLKKKAASLFSTHPPADERVRRLRQM